MDFSSDNSVGAAPAILEALSAASTGSATSYGGDALSERVRQRFCDLFEREVAVLLLPTGTAANGLALAQFTPSYGAILCHETSHAHTSECAAPEFFTGGAKLIQLKGAGGKLTGRHIAAAVKAYGDHRPHTAPLAALTLTQASELGTVYAPGDLAETCAAARDAGLKVHMDGARFANAMATLRCTPAEATWRAGVDALTFGATKNGAIAAEALIFFDPADAKDVAFRQKRAGHLWSKHRFLAAQMDAYLDDDLWLALAARANRTAQRLADGLARLPGVRLPYPTQANEVFAELPAHLADALQSAGALFYPWEEDLSGDGCTLYRFVASFETCDSEVDEAIAVLTKAARPNMEQTPAHV
ncbi:MAG: low specificity L-threonine aldolase [Pseudomonadota bacterium]